MTETVSVFLKKVSDDAVPFLTLDKIFLKISLGVPDEYITRSDRVQKWFEAGTMNMVNNFSVFQNIFISRNLNSQMKNEVALIERKKCPDFKRPKYDKIAIYYTICIFY